MVHIVEQGSLGRTQRSYRSAIEQLASAQKPGAGVPAYMRWVNRRLGRYAAAAAFVLNLTPNAVTAIGALLSGVALVVIAALNPSPGASVVAAGLLLAGFVLDSADGQLARLTRTGSVAGEWLDHVVDATRLPLIHLAIAVHLFRAGASLWLVTAALTFLVLSSAWFFAQTLAEKLSTAPADASAEAPAWVSFLKIPYDPAILYVAVALLAVPAAFATLYLALFVVTALVAALSLQRKYEALKGVAPSRMSSRAEVPE